MGKTRPLFVYFRPFLNTNIPWKKIDYKWKKHRWCGWDSNPGPYDGRRRRIHSAMAAPNNGSFACG